ncbi:hypothetical protein D0Z08_19495 [Nocardioides immobilis]|uniref:Uncharacterized protein n=1 Tax=Nocardioides immobilis TaxID=2049295 RepID=A0A417XYH4_9ACTN|nr:hypothetical protein [Nocardioides immobilis]RHW25414.1 hypothetical protein D0Z08_19495 [Nocardioides immobilis]
MEILSLLVVFAGVVGIMFLLLGGIRPTTAKPRLRDYRMADGPTIGWITPFLTMLAASSLLELSGSPAGDAATIGAAFGLLAFFCSLGGSGVRWFVDLAGGIVGAIATLAVAGAYVAGTACAPSSPGTRVVQVLLMGTLFVWAGLHTMFLRPEQLPKVGLAAFGAIEVVVFLASPLGVELTGWGQIVSMVAAMLLGALAGAAPEIVTVLAVPAAALALIGTSTVVGNACTLPGVTAGLTMLVGFSAAYFLLTLLASPFRRDRP